MRTVEKPWGHELIWAHTDRYVGKILHINKGQSLSLQYHRQKEETLYLQTGRMTVEIAKEGEALRPHPMAAGDVLHITPGLRHRMIAIEDCDVFEVSTPETDDVVRIEDRYGRTT